MSTSRKSEKISAVYGRLRSSLDAVQADLDGLRRATPGSEKLAGLRTHLRSFHDLLVVHFRMEEEGGLYRSEGEPDAGLERRMSDILLRHKRLVDRLEELSAKLDQSTGGELPSEIAPPLRALLAEIRLLENEENTLFQRLVYREVGGGD